MRYMLSLSLIMATAGLATPKELEVNLREACRLRVSGLYLNWYDKHAKAKDQWDVLSHLLQSREVLVQETEAQLTALATSLEHMPFDMEKENQLLALKYRLKSLKALVDDHKQQIPALEQEMESTQKHIKVLEEKINKVFFIAPKPEYTTSYPFHVQYQTPCPPFREVCPLPKGKDGLLRDIFKDDGGAPEVCERYMGFLAH